MRERIAQHLSNLLDGDRSPNLLGTAFIGRTKLAAEGEPTVQLPPGYSGHDYAVFLLHIAAEIEHALMVQYLYAAYSLGGPQVPESRRETVGRWQDILLGIAKEEMAHFITVQNVLRVIGGPLNLEREDYPWDVPYAAMAFSLEPLTRASLARYVYVESPDDWPADAEPFRKEITALAFEGQPQRPKQVGKLYALMISVLNDPALVPEHLFQADTLAYQASWDEWGRGYRDGARGAVSEDSVTPDLIIQTAYSRATAVAALQSVATQGEAPNIDSALGEKSHFRRFFDVFREFPDDAAGWSPSRPLAKNPTTVSDLPDTTYLEDPASRAWAELLNLRYRMLLTYLGHSFRLSGGSGIEQDAKARGMVLHYTFGEMYNLRAISRILVQLPCGGPDRALRAGPAFEMPYSVDLPYAEHDTWRLHMDLFEAAAPMIERLLENADGDGKRYLHALAELDRSKARAIEAILGAGAFNSGSRRLIGSFA